MQRAASVVLPAPTGAFRLRAVRAQCWLMNEGHALRLSAGNAAIWTAEMVASPGGAFRLRIVGDPARYLRLLPSPAVLCEAVSDATILELKDTDEPHEKGQVHIIISGSPNSFMGGVKEGLDVRSASRGGRRWQLDPADAPAPGTVAAPAASQQFKCPYKDCSLDNLTEDELCAHCEKKHARNNTMEICPICVARSGPTIPQGRQPWGFSSHLHSAHGPRAEHNNIAAGVMTYAFSLVVCRHPDGRFLLVEECCSQGWWLPGGRVDPGETFQDAAIRETIEEAGVEITLEGILAIEYAPHRHGKGDYYARQRVVFLAKPKYPDRPPKRDPDYESVGAEWISWPELEKLVVSGKRHLRGGEPAHWFSYVHNGGLVHSIRILGGEH